MRIDSSLFSSPLPNRARLAKLALMPNGYDTARFRQPNGKAFHIAKAETKVKSVYKDDDDYEKRLDVLRDEINDLQKKMFAHNHQAVLVVFQAMDAAGKDSTITHVFTGVNPMGVQVSAFKQPSSEELDHDFLWRCAVRMPQRGRIGVFNRSYYESVLVCKVHPDIVLNTERLPEHRMKEMEKLFVHRYESIRDFEQHLRRNGTHLVKFFLHVSKDEQARRLLARVDDPAKNWKFQASDLAEREHWL
jgi:PPK2 family polyphosphate:nucleotide phosphotransferase